MSQATRPVWSILTLFATAAFCAVPFFVTEFGGFNPDLFPSPQINPPVQPAGWAFAIWGVIYIWLAISAIYGVIYRPHAPDWNDMRPKLTISLMLGAAWLPIAQVSPVLAEIIIFGMAVLAVVAVHDAPGLDRWVARGPVGLYAGWLTAAGFVGLGILLAGYGVVDQTTAAIISVLLALAVALFVMTTVRDVPEYGLAFGWALAAITVANADSNATVAILAAAGAAVAVLFALRSAQRG